MAYPIDPKQGYLRTPSRFPHDAFAHDGADGCGRVRPHSGSDATPTVLNCPARSVLGGKVLRADWSIYAGNYVLEQAPDGWLWLSIHLANRLVRPGAITAPGDIIGTVGNTGGGGALGSKATIGVHIHVSRCKDMAAVDRILNGLVRARYKGESPEAWAANHGLSDPYPHIIESAKASAPYDPTDPPEEDEDMAFTDENSAQLAELARAIPAVYNWVRDMQPKVDEVWRDVNGLEWLKTQQEQADKNSFAIAQLFARVGIWDALAPGATADDIAAAVAAKLNIPGVTPEVITQIAVAVNDEAHRRSAE